jgi:hypothetical protein
MCSQALFPGSETAYWLLALLSCSPPKKAIFGYFWSLWPKSNSRPKGVKLFVNFLLPPYGGFHFCIYLCFIQKRKCEREKEREREKSRCLKAALPGRGTFFGWAATKKGPKKCRL